MTGKIGTGFGDVGGTLPPSGDFRSLAQQIRQTARAQLLQIRQAQIGCGLDSMAQGRAGPLAGLDAQERRARRLRRAERLAQLNHAAQDARLADAMVAGSIELWAAPVEGITPVLSPVAHHDLASNLEYFGPPWDPERATALLADDVPLGDFFGPVWDTVAQAAAFLAADVQEVHVTDAADPVDFDLGAVDALTLSFDMRVEDAADLPDIEFIDWAPPMLLRAVPDLAVLVPDPPETQPAMGVADSDLMLLPGSGPALIWMLQKCGVTSLAELAEADAARLVPRLGLVGQIMDVPGWQRFARRHMRRDQPAAAG